MSPVYAPDTDLLSDKRWVGVEHVRRDKCPSCGKDIRHTALVDLLYVFTACHDPHVEYWHLYEQPWHIRCFQEPAPSSMTGVQSEKEPK